MRVVVANWTGRVVGGAEAYIKEFVATAETSGIELALLSEFDVPGDRGAVEMPAHSPRWCISEMGERRALEAMRAWRPDVVYVHTLEDVGLEARLLEIAPGVLFAHSFLGMCISGEKAFKFPDLRPCSRRFGWQCLVHFYPHRCGGLSPISMWRDYGKQQARHAMLARYSAIAAGSEFMRGELIAHGAAAERVFKVPMPMNAGLPRSGHAPASTRADSAWRLLFVGRMGRLKGGATLLDALPTVAAALDSKVSVTFVGDGGDRGAWEEQARRVQSGDHRISVRFTGWLNMDGVAAVLAESDLLIVPSIWPEPFGLIGPEAGRAGVPAAAFDVGGISEWLLDGVNGVLAPGNPPSSAGLADAIVRCLRDPDAFEHMRRAAVETSRRFDSRLHVDAMLAIFREVAGLGTQLGSRDGDEFHDARAIHN